MDPRKSNPEFFFTNQDYSDEESVHEPTFKFWKSNSKFYKLKLVSRIFKSKSESRC